MALYKLLLQMADNPVVALNHAVAVAMAQGPAAGLRLVDQLAADQRLAGDYRVHSVRAHLLDMAGDPAGARDAYLAAADLARNLVQERYLRAEAAKLAR